MKVVESRVHRKFALLVAVGSSDLTDDERRSLREMGVDGIEDYLRERGIEYTDAQLEAALERRGS
jgi:hypothetical protein